MVYDAKRKCDMIWKIGDCIKKRVFTKVFTKLGWKMHKAFLFNIFWGLMYSVRIPDVSCEKLLNDQELFFYLFTASKSVGVYPAVFCVE